MRDTAALQCVLSTTFRVQLNIWIADIVAYYIWIIEVNC